MRLFGRKKEETAPKVDINLAMTKTNEAIDVLEKREILVSKKIENENKAAKECMMRGDKRSALMALKRREMYQKQMDGINNQRLTLENEKINLEAVQSQHIAVEALKYNVDAQRNASSALDVNKIEKVMDDLQDLRDARDEVDGIFSSHTAIQMDDSALLEELDQMMAEEVDSRMANAAHVPTSALPSAPQANTVPSAPQAQSNKVSDDDQLAALQAFMS